MTIKIPADIKIVFKDSNTLRLEIEGELSIDGKPKTYCRAEEYYVEVGDSLKLPIHEIELGLYFQDGGELIDKKGEEE